MANSIFALEREFEAPIDAVWNALTSPEMIAQWYGAMKGSNVGNYDLRVGGFWHSEMDMGERKHRERMEFIEVAVPNTLRWLHGMADENWQLADNPMPNWPKLLIGAFMLEDLGNKTKLTFTWAPHEADEAANQAFEAAKEGFGMGWNMGMNKVAELLKTE